MKKGKSKILITIIILLTLSLIALCIYTFFIKKCKECKKPVKCDAPTTVKCINKDTDDTKKKVVTDITYFSGKYQNIIDELSYIQFNEDGTFTAVNNQCEGYFDITGTYSTSKGTIYLTSDALYEGKDEAIIEGFDGEKVIFISNVEGKLQGCSELGYYIYTK